MVQLDRNLTDALRERRDELFTSGAVPLWGMTYARLFTQTGWWKCSARKRSGRPVSRANCEGGRLEVLVVKTVRCGHAALNAASTQALEGRILGDRLADQVGLVRRDCRSVVAAILACARSRVWAVMAPPASRPCA